MGQRQGTTPPPKNEILHRRFVILLKNQIILTHIGNKWLSNSPSAQLHNCIVANQMFNHVGNHYIHHQTGSQSILPGAIRPTFPMRWRIDITLHLNHVCKIANISEAGQSQEQDMLLQFCVLSSLKPFWQSTGINCRKAQTLFSVVGQ